MKFKGGRELKQTKVEIIPMIDTMFFLLVFFILSSVGIIKLQGININLPKPSDAQSNPNQPDEKPLELTVAINAREEVSVNRIPVPKGGDVGPVLIQEIGRQRGPGYNVEEATVVITADPGASHGAVVQAIDQARAQKLTRFAIATEAETPAPATGG